MRLIFCVVFVGFSIIGFNQELDKFVALKSMGEIPADFTTLSSEKYRTDQSENEDENLDDNFFLSTRFFMDQLLLSGAVLFNDPVTTYLNKVAQYALRDEPELLDKLRFYILKSNTPNAFSTDQGIILFTTGLIAQLENEAQLAYIICHEVSHFTEKHVRNEYVEKQNISKGRGEYRRLSYNARISQMSKYSKETELDADKNGIYMYLKSEYDIEEIFSGFEVLLYSYLPFEDIKFDTNFFNTEQLIIPGSFFPDTINEISQEMDYDDDGHTHPNIEKRMDAAFDFLGEKKSAGKKKFVVSEEEFFKVRDLARFENININLNERQYGSALYSIYLLQRRFPDNRFLDLSMVKSWYGLTKYKNHNRYNEVTLKTTKVEGESYVLHCFLKNLSRQQLNVVAFRIAFDISKKYPDDKIFQDYMLDLKKELAINSGIDPDDFKDDSYENYIAKSQIKVDSFNIEDSIRKVEESNLSKYEKIKLKKELRAIGVAAAIVFTDKDFHLYALSDLVKNDLRGDLDDLKDEYEEKLEEERIARQSQDYSAFAKSAHLGIKKLVVVDPIYDNYGLDEGRNHLKSEGKKLSLSEMYTQDYKNLELETSLVDSKNLLKSDVEEFNDLGLLMTWIAEVMAHDEMDMISSNRDQMNELSEKSGTSHFLFSAMYAYKERSHASYAHLLGILMVFTAPFAVADLVAIHNYFEFVVVEIDASKDEIEYLDYQTVNLKSIEKIMKVYVYDALYQLSSEPKN